MLTTHLLVPRRSVAPRPSFASFGWSDFDRVFDELWNGVAPRSAQASHAPRIDLTETDTELRVAAELPGLEEKDIRVTLEDGVLTIAGERSAEATKEDEKMVRHVETFRGKYSRSLRLPAEVDADAVKASYRNGILEVTLPKLPQEQPRQIPVTNGA